MWGLKRARMRNARWTAMLLALAVWPAFLSPAMAGRFEAGSFTAHDTFGNRNPVRVTFQQPFDTVPIVVALADTAGNNSASIRITNVSTTGFDELILEPDNWDGQHIAQNVHYIAVEPGRHVLPDGQIVEAGRISTAATQFGSGVAGTASWQSVSFSELLPGTPSVIAQIQSANSETQSVANAPSRPHITAIMQGLTSAGFQVALDRSQANSGPIPSSETIGWIAFPGNLSGTFPDIASNPVTWSSVNTGATIRGWDNGCFTSGIGQTSSSRIVVAKKISRNNADGGWFRRCSLNSSTIGLRVDEDRDQDNERSVASADAERASIIAFSRSFHALLEPDISASKVHVTFEDPFGGEFALPDAVVEYLITVENDGNAPPNHDSLILTEALPSSLSLVVSDFAGPGSGPIQFQDGSPSSGLSFSFAGFGNFADSVDFSTDGVNFTYTPSDSGDGTDPAVTHIRIQPAGFMAPNTGTGATSFAIRLKGKIN
ncbi:H-type lectin domain-containing protein [Parasphingorhabdus marina]|nr:H-type lectin domain-containing protein [Parasphingorhabdus marina]